MFWCKIGQNLSRNDSFLNTVLVDYVGIFFYMRQYFWPHTVLFLSNTYLSINVSTIIKLFGIGST